MTVVKEGIRDDGFSDLGKDEEEYVGADADAGGDDDDDDDDDDGGISGLTVR